MDNFFDPAATLGGEDPLRAWAQQNIDPTTGALIVSDPSKAIEAMIAKGIPPPSAMGYTDGMGAENQYPMPMGGRNPTLPTQVIGGATPEAVPPRAHPQFDPPTMPGEVFGGATPPDSPPSAPVPPLPTAAAPGSLFDRGKKMLTDNFPVFGPDGKMMGNQTSAQGQPTVVSVPPVPVVDPEPRKSRVIRRYADADPAAPSPFDPSPSPAPIPAGEVILPRPRPEGAPGSTDVSAKKKPDVAEALAGFSKSLAGVKPVQPPPVNPVGTPAVRGHSAVNAPNIQTLLQMIGQQNAPVLSTLGRLLVAGKA